MFDDDDDRFEEDLLPDRDIDDDDLIDGLDLQEESGANIFTDGSAGSGAGCLLFMLVVPVAILLMLLILS